MFDLFRLVSSHFLIFRARFLDVRQHRFVAEWKITTSTVPGMLSSVTVFYHCTIS